MAKLSNPILAGDYPDPSIVRDGADYYMTYSCGMLAPGLKILHSRDLLHWRTIGVALHGASRNIAAPDLVKYGELFYLYYPEGGTNYVVTAKHPAGPWSEPVDLHAGRIDPGHIAGADGKRYLYFSGGYAARLSDDGLSLTEPPAKVYEGWPFGDRYHTEGFWLESPKLFTRNGWYYLVSAQGGTAGPATAHMAVVARSRQPMGPWENMPSNPLIHTDSRLETWWCKGHGTVFMDRKGEWWIIYHAYHKDFLNQGRQVLLQKVTWSEDGWPAVNDAATAPIAVDVGAESPAERLDDDFAGPTLKPTWCFRKDPDPARYVFAQGGLVLEGRGKLPGDSMPMTVTCGTAAYVVEAEVAREGNGCVGLILQYDEAHYVGLGLDEKGLRLFKYGAPYVGVPLEGGHAWLRIVNDHHQVSYAYSTNETDWHAIPFGCEVSGLNHNALDGYDSLRPGLFSCGDGNGVFRHFRCGACAPEDDA